MDRYFIKEKIDTEAINRAYVPSSEQIADIFTKGVFSLVFQHLVNKLGMDDIHTPTWGGMLNKMCSFLLQEWHYMSFFSDIL